MYEYGTSFFVNMSKTPEGLASDFGCYPLELLYAIGDKVLEHVQRAKRLRLTTKAGTDISMNVHPRHLGGYFYDPRRAGPGSSKAFPAGRAGMLRAAFAATMRDAAYLAEAKKAHQEVDFADYCKMEAIVREAYSMPQSVIRKVSDLTHR